MSTTSQQVRQHIAKVQSQLGTFETLAEDDARLGRVAASVSAWSVGQHVEHLLVTGQGILTLVDRLMSGEIESAGKPKLRARAALTVGRIPRGRGKAPKVTRPEDGSPATIRAKLGSLRPHLDGLTGRAEAVAATTATGKHPFYGPLTPAMWLQFIDIHNRHHMAIIEDIEKA